MQEFHETDLQYGESQSVHWLVNRRPGGGHSGEDTGPKILKEPTQADLSPCLASMGSVLVSFPVALKKYPDERNLFEKGLILAHGSRLQSIIAGR